MSTDVTAPTRHGLTRRNLVGLGLAVLLGLADVASVLAIGQPETSGENGPPQAVLVAAAVLGVVTLAAAVWLWRGGGRLAARVIAASRILSAITALPAFFVGGVPAGLVAFAAAGVLLTLLSVWLLLTRPAAD